LSDINIRNLQSFKKKLELFSYLLMKIKQNHIVFDKNRNHIFYLTKKLKNKTYSFVKQRPINIVFYKIIKNYLALI